MATRRMQRPPRAGETVRRVPVGIVVGAIVVVLVRPAMMCRPG
jgi:hypothetical protein